MDTLKKGNEYRSKTEGIQGKYREVVPQDSTHFTQKSTQKYTLQKRGFADYLRQKEREGKSESDRDTFLVLRLSKRSGGVKGVGKWLQNFFNPNL